MPEPTRLSDRNPTLHRDSEFIQLSDQFPTLLQYQTPGPVALLIME